MSESEISLLKGLIQEMITVFGYMRGHGKRGMPGVETTFKKEKDLPVFMMAFDRIYLKKLDSATGNGDQSKTPEADDADTGDTYDYE